MISKLFPLFYVIGYGLPLAIVASPIILYPPSLTKSFLLIMSPLTYAILFVTINGLFSIPGQGGTKSGKFQANDVSYIRRNWYNTFWSAVYHFKPIYYFFLHVPFLRTYMLRLFGYRGKINFRTTPDTSIKDLTILSLGKNVQLSEHATLASHLKLSRGESFLQEVEIGDGSSAASWTVVSPGSKIGEKSEIGYGSTVGIRARVGDQSMIGPNCCLNHGSYVASRVTVGAGSYVGIRAKVESDVALPAGSNIPAGITISKQSDLDEIVKNESDVLQSIAQDCIGNFRQKYGKRAA